MTRYTLVSAILLLIGACGVQQPTPLGTPSVAPSIEPSISATATVRLQPTLAATRTTSSPTAEPTINPAKSEQRCEVDQAGSLQQLGLSPKTALVVRSNRKSADLKLIAPTSETPQLIPNTEAESGEYYEYQALSPDGDWLLYRRGVFQPNGSTADQETLWIHSIDGRVKQAQLTYWYEGEPQRGSLHIETPNGAYSWVIPNIKQGPSFGWSTSGEILIYAQPMESPTAGPVYPIFHFDPVTQTGGPVFSSEKTAGWNLGFYLGQYKATAQLYEVYYDEFYQRHQKDSAFLLYRRDKNRLYPILQWLKTADWLDGPYNVIERLRFWQKKDGQAVVLVTQPYGFDLASGLDFETLQTDSDYRDKMYPVPLFPSETGLDDFGRPFVHRICLPGLVKVTPAPAAA